MLDHVSQQQRSEDFGDRTDFKECVTVRHLIAVLVELAVANNLASARANNTTTIASLFLSLSTRSWRISDLCDARVFLSRERALY